MSNFGGLTDTGIIYKLYLECGRLINLYDLFVAFQVMVEEEPTKELYARFIQSISELQFAGFVRQTGRKTDHVMRLTWPNKA